MKLSYRRDSARQRSLRRSRLFKVTDLGTNHSKACMRLPIFKFDMGEQWQQQEIVADV